MYKNKRRNGTQVCSPLLAAPRAYAASTGKAFASSEAARRPYNFQAGVKDEVQDEAGGVPEMFVGEKRRFVVPAELCFKRRVFGQTPPKDDDVLIDVELLALQPY